MEMSACLLKTDRGQEWIHGKISFWPCMPRISMFQPAKPLKLQGVLDIVYLLHDGAWAIPDNTYNKSKQDMQNASMK